MLHHCQYLNIHILMVIWNKGIPLDLRENNCPQVGLSIWNGGLANHSPSPWMHIKWLTYIPVSISGPGNDICKDPLDNSVKSGTKKHCTQRRDFGQVWSRVSQPLSGHQNHWAIHVTHTDYKTHCPAKSDSVGLGNGPGIDTFLQDPHRIFKDQANLWNPDFHALPHFIEAPWCDS